MCEKHIIIPTLLVLNKILYFSSVLIGELALDSCTQMRFLNFRVISITSVYHQKYQAKCQDSAFDKCSQSLPHITVNGPRDKYCVAQLIITMGCMQEQFPGTPALQEDLWEQNCGAQWGLVWRLLHSLQQGLQKALWWPLSMGCC